MDATELMQKNWWEKILTHAYKNYERDGWDMVVECVEFNDFKATCNRLNLDTYEKAFEEYRQWCEQKADQREDQYAMAREGW